MTTKLRLFAGGTALAAGLLFLSGATTAAPALPKDAYKKAAEADIAALKEHLKTLSESPEDPNIKGHYRSARALSVMLAYYAEAVGDKDLREQSLKVAEELGKLRKAAFTPTAKRATDGSNKVLAAGGKAAGELAAKLAVKPGAKPLDSTIASQHAKYKIDLEEIMGPFRPGENKAAGKHYGGMNIEKDIRDAIKKDMPVKLEAPAIELIAIRTAAIGEFAVHMPNDKAAGTQANKDKWEKWTKDMIDLSGKLQAEAAKGKSADAKAMLKMLDAIDGKCKVCHNEFRDE